jgi:hypothetical protein
MDTKTELFILKSKEKHGDKYDYDKVLYIKAIENVIIICKIHGEFKQTPHNHLCGKGCIQCAGSKKLTTQEFVNKATAIHGVKYDYSQAMYRNTDTKVILTCDIHGIFEITPYCHLKGRGCKHCTSNGTPKEYKTTEIFIKEAIIIHKNSYNYDKTKYVNSTTKLIITCPIHGDFFQLPNSHLNGANCRKCASKNQSLKKSSFTEEFIEKAVKIHGTTYNYSKVKYVNHKFKVLIICHKHGEFEQSPHIHLRGSGCSNCACDKKRNDSKITQEEFIQKAKDKHGDRYDYSLLEYNGIYEKIKIVCRIHGVFMQDPHNHLVGKGCKFCGIIKGALSQTHTLQTFILKATKIHGAQYDYSKVVYVNSNTKILIICKIHGEFVQEACSYIAGNGCKKCATARCWKTTMFSQQYIIEKAIERHGDKYDYTKLIYQGSNKSVAIICRKHGEFTQYPRDHIKGGECPICIGHVITTEIFIENSIKKHGIKYDYKFVNYKTGHTPVEIICSIHGIFFQSPVNHLRSSNCCPKCMLCPSCMLWKTNGKLCEYCKPKNKNKIYQKTKEMKIVKFLKEKLPENQFIHNKSIGNDCTGGHLFPDILFDCDLYNIIIEIDEFKHRGSSYACDKQRMYDIVAKLGMPCIFVRYNPDNENSDEYILLEIITNYLNLTDFDNYWDDFGFYVNYVFY